MTTLLETRELERRDRMALIGAAIGFSVVVSLSAGSYPAARAARLDPIQAPRND